MNVPCRSCSRWGVHTFMNKFVVLPSYHGRATARFASTFTKKLHIPSSSRNDAPLVATHNALNLRRRTRGDDAKSMSGNDPLQLAEEVRGLLRKDKYDEAEDVVRWASKHGDQFTVSWNHLIDWKMSRGKINSAMKTYQDMKKRGQIPDAYTFTIILRGLAEHSHYPQALQKALSTYYSMTAENSPADPTIIHTNATLKVCARVGDMDAMFGVLAQLRPKGPNAPNNLTFTTIFNAIRQDQIEVPVDGMTSEVLQGRRVKAILNARRMWDDVVGRWRKGDIWIDEELVCSMGRLLLLGNNRDIDDIFSLVEQTMDIPRFVPRLGTEARAKIEPSLQGKAQNLEVSNSTIPDAETQQTTSTDEFSPIKPLSRSREATAYARPGPNTLSLVLEALNKLRSKDSMSQYWQVFTTTHNVLADSQNFHSYLRNLRLFRASTETVKFMMEMPKDMLEKKTFRIGLSTCVRDKNNPGVFANAGKLLDLMQSNLPDPDIPALDSYLEVAITSPVYSNNPTAGGQAVRLETAKGRQILRALERLGPNIINLRSAYSYGEFSKEDGRHLIGHQSKQRGEDMVDLFRRTISAYDLLMNKAMVERTMYAELTARRSKIAAFITRSKARNQRLNESSSKEAKFGSGANINHFEERTPSKTRLEEE